MAPRCDKTVSHELPLQSTIRVHAEVGLSQITMWEGSQGLPHVCHNQVRLESKSGNMVSMKNSLWFQYLMKWNLKRGSSTVGLTIVWSALWTWTALAILTKDSDVQDTIATNAVQSFKSLFCKFSYPVAFFLCKKLNLMQSICQHISLSRCGIAPFSVFIQFMNFSLFDPNNDVKHLCINRYSNGPICIRYRPHCWSVLYVSGIDLEQLLEVGSQVTYRLSDLWCVDITFYPEFLCFILYVCLVT